MMRSIHTQAQPRRTTYAVEFLAALSDKEMEAKKI